MSTSRLPEPTVDPREVQRVLDDVYAGPDFAGAEPGLLERAFGRVLEVIARLFDAAAGTATGRVVGIVLLVALAAALGWVVARGLSRVRRDKAQPVEVDHPAGRPSVDWEAEAQAHGRAGEHRAALRCHYRATLAWLSEQGLIEEVPGTTTGEYRAAVAEAAPGARAAFDTLTDMFERAWYGHAEMTAVDVEAAQRASAATRTAVRRPVGASA